MNGPAVAVGGVVVHDGRVLLVRRAQDPGAGHWSVPGGRVEPGETLQEAVVREVAQETGLDVVVGGFLGWVQRITDAHHFVILDFLALPEDPSQPPQAGDDADDVAWIDLADLGEFDLVDGLYDFFLETGVVSATRTLDLEPPGAEGEGS